MIVGAGGVAAIGVAGVPSAFAAPDASNQGGLGGLSAAYTPGATTPGLSYTFLSAYGFTPTFPSTNPYATDNGRFRYTTASGGYAGAPLELPAGSVIRELEFYGTRSAAGSILCELWRSGPPASAGAAVLEASASAPAANGEFTVALATNETVSLQDQLVPFVSIGGTYASLYGVRVGYSGPTQLFLLPAPVRVYDSRPGAGGEGPFLVGVTRTVNCATGPAPASTPAVPAGAKGALLTVTIDGTVGGGFLQVYSEALASPPSASSANWYESGQSQANAVTTAVNGSKVKVTCGGNPGSSTNVLVDVVGYYM